MGYVLGMRSYDTFVVWSRGRECFDLKTEIIWTETIVDVY